MDAITHFEEYTRNAEELAKEMAKEDAVHAALEVLDAEATEARKSLPVVRHSGATAQAHVQLTSSSALVGKGGTGAREEGKVKVAINEEEGRIRVGLIV